MKSLTASRIKEALDLRVVMEHYGVHFNQHGFAHCPFHEEKTASLSVKGGFFKCFGCGAGGDIFAFTMKYFGISFPQALLRLDSDFHLGVLGRKPTRQEITALQQERQMHKQEVERLQAEYMYYTRLHRILWRAYIRRAPQKIGDQIDDRYAAACRYLPALDYWFETHEWVRG